MADEKAPERHPDDIVWPLEHPLSATVQAHGEDIRVLILQEPLGDDVLAFGLLEGLEPNRFFPLVAKLAAVPESTLKKIPGKDLLKLATKLNRFFVWAAR